MLTHIELITFQALRIIGRSTGYGQIIVTERTTPIVIQAGRILGSAEFSKRRARLTCLRI